jgi:plastocyanin domain-containing protein
VVAAALLLAALAAQAQHSHGGGQEPRSGGPAQPYVPTERPPEPEIRVVRVDVTERGFAPAQVTVRRGQRVRLVVTRRTDATCAKEIILDEYLVWRRLPLNESVSDTFTTDRTGDFPFRCAAGHVTGVFKVEP